MKMITTLQLLSDKLNVPTTTAWYLADLGEARGKQDLFKKQSPQRLRSLREHALIESAVSSNRIEGVTVTSSSQALGSYDVRYQGLNYLIRAEAAGDATRVTAFTSEGAAAANSPAGRLLAILKSRLE